MSVAVLQVLETHIFHSFLKDRLNRKMDNFARMELSTRSEMQKWVINLIFFLKGLKPNDIHHTTWSLCPFVDINVNFTVLYSHL